MLIRQKHASPLGYFGTQIFQSTFHWLYKKEFPDSKTFVVINNHEPQQVEMFRLTADEYKKYKKNKLSLVPCGHAGGLSGNEYVTGNVMWSGEFKSKKHLETIITHVEALI